MLENGKMFNLVNMKKLQLVIIIISFFCISCSIKNTNDMKDKEIEFVELNDLKLDNIVNEYYNENLKKTNFDYALILEYSKDNNTILLELYYELNLSTLVADLPSYYTVINDKVIFIKTNLKYTPVSSESADSLFNRIFPNQYNYYNEHGEFPPPITFSGEKWKYKNSVLIGKELH